VYDVRHGILQAVGGWGGSGDNNVKGWKLARGAKWGGVSFNGVRYTSFYFRY